MSKEVEKEQEVPGIFPQKYLKKLNNLSPEFIETIDGLDTEEIKKRIVSSENNIYEIEKEKDNNSEILRLKEELKLINGPFAEAKGLETAKIKYCLFTLSNRGVKI